MSINPSQAEGLEVCTEAQLGRETSRSGPGDGCPQASKVGTIEVETPLLKDETLKGSLYVAEPYHNLADDSLIAVYVVIKHPERGISVIQPLRVEPDPETGRLVTYSEDMPQLPFSEFRLHFREGGRSPLITPPGCGRFEVEASFTPWAGGEDHTTTSELEIVSGPNGSPCPSGTAPFEPGFEAGTTNNAAGAHSPFAMRITRGDGMQDLSKFSAVLPPGVVGKIAGIPWCPEAGIARAKSRTGENGGRDELADPSCPAASLLGRTVGGAGVGSQLTYVDGSLYLAGPYKGAPLSVVSITPAVAGPFDAGVIAVRVGLDLNPITGVVEADGSRSDPIPHILKGIPLNVRDLRVYTDRPGFTLNATSCREEQTYATLWRAGTVLDPSFETPVARAARYQAAGCASLGFSPKLGIKLKGGAKRGKFPALRAGLPQILRQQPPRRGLRPHRPALGPDPDRGRGADRLGQGAPAGDRGGRPRRAGLARDRRHAGGTEGPVRQLPPPLLQAEAQPGEGEPARPERRPLVDQAALDRGRVREAQEGQASAGQALGGARIARQGGRSARRAETGIG